MTPEIEAAIDAVIHASSVVAVRRLHVAEFPSFTADQGLLLGERDLARKKVALIALLAAPQPQGGTITDEIASIIAAARRAEETLRRTPMPSWTCINARTGLTDALAALDAAQPGAEGEPT